MALVVFLRGVNVGGHKTLRPSLVANQMSDFDVVNVGAAGTFVVRKRISQAKLRAELLRWLPFEVEVVIVKGDDVLDLASGNPFAGGARAAGLGAGGFERDGAIGQRRFSDAGAQGGAGGFKYGKFSEVLRSEIPRKVLPNGVTRRVGGDLCLVGARFGS